MSQAKIALTLFRYRHEIAAGVNRAWRWLRRSDSRELRVKQAALREAQKGVCSDRLD